MKLPFRQPRSILIISALLWAGGVAFIWWLIPVGPRDGWQPPEDEYACGFLNDGRILVTRPASLDGTRKFGPVRLWDIETGQVRASHFGREDVFARVLVFEELNLLKIRERVGARDDHDFRLRMVDPWTSKDVASFACHVPQDNGWWICTLDGKTTAYVTFEKEEPRVEWHDVASGKLLYTLLGWGGMIQFSADGCRFAASRVERDANDGFVSAIGVWEVPTGKQLAAFTHKANGSDTSWPKEFSPDNELLLDGKCHVWEVATGKLRFQVPGIYYNSSTFTSDGRHLVVVATSKSGCSLAYYDLATGKEVVERRVPLTDGKITGMHLHKDTRYGRFLILTGWPRSREPTRIEQLLAKLPRLERLAIPKQSETSVVVESQTGREITRIEGNIWGCTPDGRFLLSDRHDNVYEIWDIPPRKPGRWLVWPIAGWTLVLGLLTLWFGRRKRPSSLRRLETQALIS